MPSRKLTADEYGFGPLRSTADAKMSWIASPEGRDPEHRRPGCKMELTTRFLQLPDRSYFIFGPRGTQAYIDGLMALWRPELEQRIAHERRPSTAALEVEVREVADP